MAKSRESAAGLPSSPARASSSTAILKKLKRWKSRDDEDDMWGCRGEFNADNPPPVPPKPSTVSNRSSSGSEASTISGPLSNRASEREWEEREAARAVTTYMDREASSRRNSGKGPDSPPTSSAQLDTVSRISSNPIAPPMLNRTRSSSFVTSQFSQRHDQRPHPALPITPSTRPLDPSKNSSRPYDNWI